MRGILQGMGLTLRHLTRPRVTRLYPYEKRQLAERSRGLIQLIADPEEDTPFNLKCEACLLCEKACPPRCITIEYRPTQRFRKRNYFSDQAVAGFYAPRMSEYAVDYPNRPFSPPVETPTRVDLEAPVDLSIVDGILDRASLEAHDLTTIINEVMDAYGSLPLAAAQRIVERRGVDLSDIFGIATASPRFAPAQPTLAHVLRDDQVPRGPSPSTRGKYANINHRRGPSA
jgi:ferredoxin